MQGALWVQLTQTLICNDKVNDGAYLGLRPNFPPGTLGEPLQPAGLDRQCVVLPDPVLHRLHQVALARAAGARVRRGGAGALRPHRERVPGRRHRPVRHASRRRRTSASRASAAARKMVLDGLDYGGGHVEPRGRHGRHGDVGADRALPVPRPARQAQHGRAGPPPRRLGLRVPAPRLEDALLRDAEHRQRPRASCRPGCGAAIRRRGLPAQHPQHELLRARRARRALSRLHEPDPADSELARDDHRATDQFDQRDDDAARGDARGRPLPVHVPRRRRRGRPARAALRGGDGGHRGRFLLPRFAESVYGVVPGDAAGHRGAARGDARGARGARPCPVREWMAARARAHPRRRLDRAGPAHVRGVDAALRALGRRVPRVLGPARGLRVRRAHARGRPGEDARCSGRSR